MAQTKRLIVHEERNGGWTFGIRAIPEVKAEGS